MKRQVAILHGWSDDSKSFRPLRNFLVDNNFDTANIFLGDYISLDDDVRIEDVAIRMQAVIEAARASGSLEPSFDMIVHSTGGLVAREWISRFYPQGTNCPVKRLIMLAPANFGSRLASTGKSMIGRVVKGWGNWLQSGQQMLESLELASEYQWDLARRDLLDPHGIASGPYGEGKVLPFVICGSIGYSDGLRQIVNEKGSDGTIRCAAANLNAIGMTIEFKRGEKIPVVETWHRRAGDIEYPFAILHDRNHGSICDPKNGSNASDGAPDHLGGMLIEALACDGIEGYGEIAKRWKEITEATAALALPEVTVEQFEAAFASPPRDRETLHQYFHIVIYVRDDHGQPIDDYFIEYFAPGRKKDDQESVTFHRDVLDHVHVNSLSAARRAFFADRTDLMSKYYPIMRLTKDRVVAVSLSAADPGPNVKYFDNLELGATGTLVIHQESDDRRDKLGDQCLHRNTTHLIEIIIPRHPVNKVFAFVQD